MNPRRILRHLLAATATLAVAAAWPQQPFDLDPSFRTTIPARGVSSILPSADGKVWISGFMWSAIAPFYNRLNHDGTGDMGAPHLNNAGFFRPWNDQFYLGDATPFRYFQDGTKDTTFDILKNDTYHPLQAGDYFVLPDGGVLISGVLPVYEIIGQGNTYCLLRFTNDGSLDTTFQPRTCAGSLDFFTELPNGQFIGSGSTGIWDGQAASNIIRFNADGSLDPTFQSNVWWGQAYSYLPLADGRVYVGGEFKITGIQDTLNLVRFMPDGSLDPTFNNTAKYRDTQPLYPTSPPWGIVRGIYPLAENQLIVTGNFGTMDGQPRGAIALIDTVGNLQDDYFAGTGCGVFYYQPNTSIPPSESFRVIWKIVPAPDGSYYIYGAYHGYDDGSTNYPSQHFVSRLYGLNVGINEHGAGQAQQLQIAPNPSAGQTVLSLEAPPQKGTLTIHDASGRVVWQEPWPAGAYTHTLRAGALAPGTYMLRVQEEQGTSYSGKLIILP